MVEFLMQRITFLEEQVKLAISNWITQLKNDMCEIKKFMSELSSGLSQVVIPRPSYLARP